MSVTHHPVPLSGVPPRAFDPRRTAAVLLAVEGLLLIVPIVVLGAAIGWPASLDDPAAIALPRLLENEGAVRAGYAVYLVYSVLFLPVAVWTGRALTGGTESLLTRLAVGFAVASTLARTIGISRWLLAMPGLAETYGAASDAAAREAVAVQYQVLNDFGGGVGEVLGVSLFAVGWLVCASVAALRARTAPRWLLIAALLTAAGLALPLVELAGADPGAATSIGSALLQLWFLAAAVVLARRAR
ncbi:MULTISPECIES: DUF4386 family protein [unclassified Streptomyces]|uniref:DUF4386 family protein n=1 Tax=Streptomycetaceae TaxID=2062 RepID=UPI002E796881|nr:MULTISPECIES: DUF4386 family protein [unclassified Streptomyces]MED7951121.1 DUF4386 family protein [Streptomyces sp. BE303]MEE1822185.1 DUF4386 family protein [Streptomyces sp. BE20]